MRSADETTVGVQVAKAFIGGSDLSWYTSVLRARVLTPVGDRAAFLADWGVSIAGVDAGSDATLGNPELGLAFVDDDGRQTAFLSVVLPLSSQVGDDDISVGHAILSDFSWPDRFLDEVWSANVGYTPSAVVGGEGRARVNLELIGSVFIPTDVGDNELFARYAFGLSQDTDAVRLRADLVGWAILSEDGLSLGERTMNELVLGVDALGGGPGFFVRIPLDDDLEAVDAVVGASFTWF